MLSFLIATDGSDHALHAIEAVAALARAGCQLQARLVHVRDVPVMYGGEMPIVNVDEIDALYRRAQDDLIAKAEKEAAARGLALQPSVRRVGFASDEIARTAKEVGATHIVMGTRGLGSVRSLIIGSVAQRVVHAAEVPVMLVK